jgi:hypothetical protein
LHFHVFAEAEKFAASPEFAEILTRMENTTGVKFSQMEADLMWDICRSLLSPETRICGAGAASLARVTLAFI